QPVRAARRSDEEPAAGDGAGARGGRRRVSSRREALADAGRSGVEDAGGLGQSCEVTCSARLEATKTRKHETALYKSISCFRAFVARDDRRTHTLPLLPARSLHRVRRAES